MRIVRLALSHVALAALDQSVLDEGSRVVVSCDDATTVVAMAAQADRFSEPVGVWLEVDGDYPAQLVARDVATLSWLIALDTVVVAAPTLASDHARVVEALLSDDEVTLRTDVATIVGAYNRPAPPRAIEVWSFDGTQLRRGTTTLREVASQERSGGLATVYE